MPVPAGHFWTGTNPVQVGFDTEKPHYDALYENLQLLKWLVDNNGNLQFPAGTVLTVAAGAITPTQNLHALDTSGGAGNLNTLNLTNCAPGFLLVLCGNNPASNPVTLVSGGGNCQLQGGSITFDVATKFLVLLLIGSTWYELCRSGAASPSYQDTSLLSRHRNLVRF